MKFEPSKAFAVEDQPQPLARIGRCSLIALVLALLLLASGGAGGLPAHYFRTADGPAALVAGLFFALVALRMQPRWQMRALPLGWAAVSTIAVALVIACWAGTYLLMFDYPLTRDEHMVVFDMVVFGRGQLATPLASDWRPLIEALTPAFLLDLPGDVAWVSSYGPGNAALRTIFAVLADPALMNPLLAGIGFVALFGVARRLFPASPGAQATALILYATSAQVLVTAMTTYAMTAHLAFNLVWLLLFLRGGMVGHSGAIATGFVATGLHQVIFHPLFVLPFLVGVARAGRWRLAALYSLAYAAIGLFWMSYPGLVAQAAGLAGTEQGAAAGAGGFLTERVLPLLTGRDPNTIQLMLHNLLRFVGWQNLALIPLALAAVALAKESDNYVAQLCLGVLLTLLAVMLLLPYQGHGWGYRYVHGLIGSLALLGGYGFQRLASGEARVGPTLVLGTLLTLCVLLPWQLFQARAFVAPYARVDRAIERLGAEMVVIDTDRIDFAIDQVRNQPDLSNRPLRLSSRHLRPDDMASMCRRGSIAFVSREAMQRLGLGPGQESSGPDFHALRGEARRLGCLSGD